MGQYDTAIGMCITVARTMATKGGEAIDEDNVTNYDILVSSDESLFHQEELSHIGNMRFQVDLVLRQEAYRRASQSGDMSACDEIVESIIHTVMEKSVPGGRFLVRHLSPRQLRELTQDETRQRIHQALQQSISSNKTVEKEKEATTETSSSASLRSSPASFTETGHAVFPTPAPHPPTPWEQNGLKLPPPLQSADLESHGIGDTSTTRLGRANLDSMVVSSSPCIQFQPSQPSGGKDGSVVEPTSLPDSMFISRRASEASSCRVIPETSMDVVMDSDCQGLLPDSTHIGNNRFRVLMDIQPPTFAVSHPRDKQVALVDEIYSTVTKHWAGTFQCMTPSIGLVELSPAQAHHVILYMLRNGSRGATSLPVEPPLDPSSTGKPLARSPSLTTTALCSTWTSHPMSIKPSRRFSLENAAMPTVQPRSSDAMRRRSIEDLKRKKARKEMSRKIERQGTHNMRRQSSLSPP